MEGSMTCSPKGDDPVRPGQQPRHSSSVDDQKENPGSQTEQQVPGPPTSRSLAGTQGDGLLVVRSSQEPTSQYAGRLQRNSPTGWLTRSVGWPWTPGAPSALAGASPVSGPAASPRRAGQLPRGCSTPALCSRARPLWQALAPLRRPRKRPSKERPQQIAPAGARAQKVSRRTPPGRRRRACSPRHRPRLGPP